MLWKKGDEILVVGEQVIKEENKRRYQLVKVGIYPFLKLVLAQMLDINFILVIYQINLCYKQVVGFILMLLPIGEMKDVDPEKIQPFLSSMSGGMAVALYTTLSGLITSTMLKFQYFLLDSSLSKLINGLTSGD